MKKIQMVDLVSQYEPIRGEVEASLQRIFATAAYINGPEVKAFCEELAAYLHVKHVIPCANGTDALQIAMMALGYEPGDEIIVPNFTYISTIEVIALLRLTPVLVDVDPESFNIDVEAARRAITPRTKAILPVHLYGQSAHMEPLLELAREHNLHILEDNAQALGARYRFSDGRQAFTGTMGQIGTTSFYPSKNLSCAGDGGALFTNDDDTADALRTIANHGQNRRYYFDKVGVNSRLDSVQAAVLRAKLRRLNAYTEARQKAAATYDAAFASHPLITVPARMPWSTHVFHQYTIQVPAEDRDALQAHLTQQEIPSVVFYPLPIHQQNAYRDDSRWSDSQFPHTVNLCQRVLSLPMHTELDDDQLAYITQAVLGYFTNKA
jgi:dTDP-4-amino-4,6-dideoxygalactose transaminase